MSSFEYGAPCSSSDVPKDVGWLLSDCGKLWELSTSLWFTSFWQLSQIYSAWQANFCQSRSYL